MPFKVFFPTNSGFTLIALAQRAVPCRTEMKVDQLLPNAVKPLEPQSANVSSLEELLQLPWIKLVAESDGKLHRFSYRRMDDHWLLLADFHGTWRVMALVSGDDVEHIINPLPVWTYSKSPTS
jgi:hypothetical protein